MGFPPPKGRGPRPLQEILRDLKEWRDQVARRTQREIAERAGISVSYLSMIEAAKRTPDPEIAERLARALGLPPRRRQELLAAVHLARGGTLTDALRAVDTLRGTASRSVSSAFSAPAMQGPRPRPPRHWEYATSERLPPDVPLEPVLVPVFPDGVLPGEGDPLDEPLRLDPRLVGGHPHPFAWVLGSKNAARADARHGDLLLLASPQGLPAGRALRGALWVVRYDPYESFPEDGLPPVRYLRRSASHRDVQDAFDIGRPHTGEAGPPAHPRHELVLALVTQRGRGLILESCHPGPDPLLPTYLEIGKPTLAVLPARALRNLGPAPRDWLPRGRRGVVRRRGDVGSERG